MKDGWIVLNIAERAVAHLQMDNDDVRFSARFGGVSHAVIVPIDAVVAIYARENGQGAGELPPDIATQGSASGRTNASRFQARRHASGRRAAARTAARGGGICAS